MKRLALASLLAAFTLSACGSYKRTLIDTPNAMYGSHWEYVGTMIVYPNVIYKDNVSAASQTTEVVIHDGIISYAMMLEQARAIYGDDVTIANIRIYSEGINTKWINTQVDKHAIVDVIRVTKVAAPVPAQESTPVETPQQEVSIDTTAVIPVDSTATATDTTAI